MPEIEIHYPDGLVGYKALSTEAPLVVGSATGCDVQIEGPDVAKKHFLFRWSNSGNTWRFDVGKEYDGVLLNGRPSKGDPVGPDDEVSLGDYTFIYRDSTAPRAAAGVQVVRPVAMMQNYDERDYYTPLLQQKTFRTILISIIAVVLIGGVSYFGYHATRADKLYNEAKKNLDADANEKALNEFKAFRDEYPSHRYASRAKILQDVATIKGLIQSGQQYGAALLMAEQSLKANEKNPALREAEISNSIVEPLVAIGKGAAERAKDVRVRIDGDALRTAKASLALADRVGQREGELLTKYDAAMELTNQAAAAIEKETLRRGAIQKMQEAIDAKKPMGVYGEHRQLYARYPDLKLDAESVVKRSEARKIEQSLTGFRAAPAGAAPAPKTAAPINGRTPISRTAGSEAAPSNRIAIIQAADTLFGVDTGSGEVKWTLPVGLDPSFAPQKHEEKYLVHRTRDNSLVLIDPAKGEKEVWATPLTDKVLRYISRPLVYQNRVYISGFDSKDVKSGRLYVFGFSDGRFMGEIVFPQPLAGMPVLDSKRRMLLVPGDQATVYAVNPTNNQCTMVYQMGHEPGTLAWVPMLAGRFLFAIENYAPGKSTLRVFVLSGEDGSLRERGIGELSQLPGSVRRDPILMETRLFVMTDRDAFVAFDLGGEEDERPIQLAARNIPPVAVKQAPDAPFPITKDPKHLWTAGERITLYEFRGGVMEPPAAFKQELNGPAAIPPILDDKILIVGARVGEGKVQVVGFDAVARKEKWRLELVLPPKAVTADPSNKDAVLLTLAGGATISLPVAELGKSAPIDVPATTAERAFDAEADFYDIPGWSEGVVQWSGVGRGEIRAFPRGKPAKKFSMPSTIAAVPGVFEQGLIVPCHDGMVYWIDPATGADLAEPFGVSFMDGKPVDLGTGVGIDKDAAVVIAGTSLIRLELERKGFPHFREKSRMEIPEAHDTLKVESAVVRQWLSSVHMVRMGDRLLVTAGRNVHRLLSKGAELILEKTIKLGGNVPSPATRLGSLAVFITDRRELAAFGPPAAKQPADLVWRLRLPRPSLGPPKPSGDGGFWLAYADGRVVEHSTADGKPKRELNAGRNLLDGPWLVADRLVVLTPVGGLAALEVR